MKICKLLLLLGLYITSTESTVIMLTTYQTNQGRPNQQKRNIKPKEHFCS